MQTLCSRSMQQARPASRRLIGLPPVGRIQAHLRPIRPLLVVRAHADNNQTQAAAATADAAIIPHNPKAANLAPAAAAAQSGPTKVNVHFEVPEYVTSWGQVLKVVGSLDELGDWKVEQAPAMEWHEGHSWTLDIQLPVGAVNFKVVMQEHSGAVRWEQGTDRSVLIPETTSVTGAPVGEVGVTCSFNDVQNSHVEVRPDKNYLKQQLKAVEARVMAIQEKKRKLDQRMAVLTEGLKKYDHTVALLEGGVQEAVEQRQREKEAAAQQQQLQQQAAAAILGNNGSNQQQQSKLATQATAAAQNAEERAPESSSSTKGGIMVPILNPADLPSFDDLSYDVQSSSSLSTASSEEDASPASTAAAHMTSDTPSSADSMASSDDESALVQQSAPAGAAVPDVSAIKASHVNETVLSATVDQLLAAAEDALARSSSNGSSLGSSTPASGMKQGTTGVDDSQLAEEYVEELLAAASALEQQSDQRANLLLEAAKQTGNETIAQDIEKLSSLPIPALPTPDQLVEAAAAETAVAVDVATAAADVTVDACATVSLDDSTSDLAQQVVTVEELTAIRPSAPELAPARPSSPVPAAMKVNTDGTITFSAESLSMDVDVNELLAAVLSRIDVPLSSMGKVTITATITPAVAAAPAEQQEQQAVEQQQQEDVQQQQPVVVAAQQQQEQPLAAQEPPQQQEEQEVVKKQHASPADAIAAVFSSTLSTSDDDGDDDDLGTTTSSSNRSSSRRTQWPNNGSSNSNGSGSTGRYSKTGSSRVSEGARAAAAAAVAGGCSKSAVFSGASRPTAWDLSEVDRQLAAKEAARKAAAEKVAAALAQVEEMRRSVVAANILLAEQLRGSSSTAAGYSPLSQQPIAGAPAASAASNSMQGSSGTYSKYRLSFKDGQAVATPAFDSTAPTAAPAAPSTGSAHTGPISGSRSMPTVGAAAVVSGPSHKQEGATKVVSNGIGSSGSVDGVVKEELLALAALAAAVQSADAEHVHQAQESQDEF